MAKPKKISPCLVRAHFLRDKYHKVGLDGLSVREVLELLLGYLIDLRTIPEVSDNLIRRFGSMAGILNASHFELMEVPRMTEYAAFYLERLSDIYSAICSDNVPKGKVTREVALNYFQKAMIGLDHEEFRAMFLRKNMNFKAVETIGVGYTDSVRVRFGKIENFAFQHHCTNVILCHNHPFSTSVPSTEDIAVTREIKEQLERSDINVLYHFIVGADGVNEVPLD